MIDLNFKNIEVIPFILFLMFFEAFYMDNYDVSFIFHSDFMKINVKF